jgi:hypothetical protein
VISSNSEINEDDEDGDMDFVVNGLMLEFEKNDKGKGAMSKKKKKKKGVVDSFK